MSHQKCTCPTIATRRWTHFSQPFFEHHFHLKFAEVKPLLLFLNSCEWFIEYYQIRWVIVSYFILLWSYPYKNILPFLINSISFSSKFKYANGSLGMLMINATDTSILFPAKSNIWNFLPNTHISLRDRAKFCHYPKGMWGNLFRKCWDNTADLLVEVCNNFRLTNMICIFYSWRWHPSVKFPSHKRIVPTLA